MAADKATKTSEPKQAGPTAGDIVLLVGLAGGGYLIYRLIKGGLGPCTPGTTKCDGYNLYTCNGEGQWVLTKSNSPQCGYTPEIWFAANEELGRQSFSVAVVDVGWRGANIEIGREDFSVAIADVGWRAANIEIGTGNFGVVIVDTGWRAANIELGTQSFSVNIL